MHRMSLKQYDSLKEWLDGRCPGCGRATGVTKALAVEHDHVKAAISCDHPTNQSCVNCWRGLLCGPCNDVLAHCRDSVEMLKRLITYLENPPAQAWRHSRAFMEALREDG